MKKYFADYPLEERKVLWEKYLPKIQNGFDDYNYGVARDSFAETFPDYMNMTEFEGVPFDPKDRSHVALANMFGWDDSYWDDWENDYPDTESQGEVHDADNLKATRKSAGIREMIARECFEKTGRIPDVDFMDTYQFQKAPIYDIKPDSVADVTMNTPQLEDDSLSLLANKKIMNNAGRQAAYAQDAKIDKWVSKRGATLDDLKDPVDYKGTEDLTLISPRRYGEVVVFNNEGDRFASKIPDLKSIEDMDEFYQNAPPCPTKEAYDALRELVGKYGAHAVQQAMIETIDARNVKDHKGRAQTTVADDAKRVQDLLEYNEKKNPKENKEPRVTKYPNMSKSFREMVARNCFEKTGRIPDVDFMNTYEVKKAADEADFNEMAEGFADSNRKNEFMEEAKGRYPHNPDAQATYVDSLASYSEIPTEADDKARLKNYKLADKPYRKELSDTAQMMAPRIANNPVSAESAGELAKDIAGYRTGDYGGRNFEYMLGRDVDLERRYKEGLVNILSKKYGMSEPVAQLAAEEYIMGFMYGDAGPAPSEYRYTGDEGESEEDYVERMQSYLDNDARRRKEARKASVPK